MVPQHLTNATDLGIDLKSGSDHEYFKWFIACLLFGKPVQQPISVSAYQKLEEHDLLSPDALLDAGWDRIRETLDEAHYARYDHDTSWKLLGISEKIKEEYGSFGELMEESQGVEDFGRKLKEFKGVGPKVLEIFMRDAKPQLKAERWKGEKEEDEEEGEEEEEEDVKQEE